MPRGGSRIDRVGELFTRDGGKSSVSGIVPPNVAEFIIPTIDVADADHRDTYGGAFSRTGVLNEFSIAVWDIPTGVSIKVRNLTNEAARARVFSLDPVDFATVTLIQGFFPLSGRLAPPCPVRTSLFTQAGTLIPVGPGIPMTLPPIATDAQVYANPFQASGPAQIIFQNDNLNQPLIIHAMIEVLPGPTP